MHHVTLFILAWTLVFSSWAAPVNGPLDAQAPASQPPQPSRLNPKATPFVPAGLNPPAQPFQPPPAGLNPPAQAIQPSTSPIQIGNVYGVKAKDYRKPSDPSDLVDKGNNHYTANIPHPFVVTDIHGSGMIEGHPASHRPPLAQNSVDAPPAMLFEIRPGKNGGPDEPTKIWKNTVFVHPAAITTRPVDAPENVNLDDLRKLCRRGIGGACMLPSKNKQSSTANRDKSQVNKASNRVAQPSKGTKTGASGTKKPVTNKATGRSPEKQLGASRLGGKGQVAVKGKGSAVHANSGGKGASAQNTRKPLTGVPPGTKSALKGTKPAQKKASTGKGVSAKIGPSKGVKKPAPRVVKSTSRVTKPAAQKVTKPAPKMVKKPAPKAAAKPAPKAAAKPAAKVAAKPAPKAVTKSSPRPAPKAPTPQAKPAVVNKAAGGKGRK